VPLYRTPPDLVTADLGLFRPAFAGERIAGRVDGTALKPYAKRAEIERGALAGRGLELVWVDDAADAFFLHIQGSGRVTLEDGSVVRVGYAGGNGHAYTAIGRELARRGVMAPEDVSMQSLRAWLANNPDEAQALMEVNDSYVFFRILEGEGPLGSQGVVLTPGRSLAVDARFLPLGAPVWLATTDPVDAARPLRRLTVAQDTGGAIRGPARADLFWGHGADAAERAGRMRQEGELYLLLPRALGDAIAR
jgi:membrane-bound lytic murein transglycosylase A